MFVIGTAGHIDHGKSTLVHALTGIDPDRLREEKERGMTIDLGFAWLKLPSGKEVGIIDVPGHERFIKNMLAGAGGIDVALLTIAANEGGMPQTKEHLAILDLLEVKKGIVVITKKDLVDAELLDLVKLEIEDLVHHTSLKDASVVAVSALTRDGLPDLIATIDQVLASIQPRSDMGRPRLLIDRSFTIAGSGTVVTGTLIDGSLMQGQEAEIQPSGLKVRIRGLQSHKSRVEKVVPGTRVAANIVGAAASDLKRGDVLTNPGWLVPTRRLDVQLRLLSTVKRPLRHGSPVSFHTGAAEVMAKLRLLAANELNPGESGMAQLILSDPIATVKNDRFIIRSPNDTLGGGTIINTHTARHKRFKSGVIESLKDMSEGGAGERVLAALEVKQPLTVKALAVECNMSSDEIAKIVDGLLSDGKIVAIGTGESRLLVARTFWARLAEKATALVDDYHRRYPARPGMPKGELIGKLNVKSYPVALQRLFDDGVFVDDGATIRKPSFTIQLTGEQQAKVNRFLKALDENPFSPSADVTLEPDLLAMLIKQDRVVKVSDGVVFSKAAYDEMVKRVVAYGKEKGRITVAEARDLLGTSRKYALALMEYLDDKKITRRIGDERVIR